MDTTLIIPPSPVPAPAAPNGPRCILCGAPAIVHWNRRLTDEEYADYERDELSRRAERRLLADPAEPALQFRPLWDRGDILRPVHSCGPHAITLEAAALVHASSCTAPNEADLPNCDCVPEKPPAEVAPGLPAETVLPDHWQPGGR
ncbi:hypothetical protein ACIP98_20960 [Streptomyces sp. NPDC088354]|uniref:hypothetical protein n=1 Tax=Streptomyces sp. NPDC088354 TaxID=3365856 RepID=UPI003800C2DB